MKTAAICCLVLLFACGGGDGGLDERGLAAGETALGQFARASQLYWRGSLSASREEFNGVIYRFPGSPLADDARLAVRRIDGELGGDQFHGPATPAGGVFRGFSITLVGDPGARAIMETLGERLSGRGSTVDLLFDPQSPEVTVVLYRQGYEEGAGLVADSLSGWLARPSAVEHQGGGGLIDAVAPGSGGIMVVVGTDARLAN